MTRWRSWSSSIILSLSTQIVSTSFESMSARPNAGNGDSVHYDDMAPVL